MLSKFRVFVINHFGFPDKSGFTLRSNRLVRVRQQYALFQSMAQPLLIAHPENASIEELKQVSPVGSNETATRCSAIQMLLAGGSVLSQTRRCAKDASAMAGQTR